jgi:hypothetical protein
MLQTGQNQLLDEEGGLPGGGLHLVFLDRQPKGFLLLQFLKDLLPWFAIRRCFQKDGTRPAQDEHELASRGALAHNNVVPSSKLPRSEYNEC